MSSGLEILFRIISSSNYREEGKIYKPQSPSFDSMRVVLSNTQ